MLVWSNLLVIVLLSLCSCWKLTLAQQFEDGDAGGNPQQQQQQITLTKEAIEKILSMLSGGCRSEMESALAMKGEISDECKMEIQNSMRQINIADYSPQNGASEDENRGPPGFDGQDGGRQQQQRRRDRTPQENWIDPYYAIAGFTFLLFGSVISYVLYFNTVAAPDRVLVKPKKLSKKKVRTLQCIFISIIILRLF